MKNNGDRKKIIYFQDKIIFDFFKKLNQVNLSTFLP